MKLNKALKTLQEVQSELLPVALHSHNPVKKEQYSRLVDEVKDIHRLLTFISKAINE
jgi:arabinogalactan endo-1,4-beta-galactosidase